jgi:hypothetical protein
MDIGSNWVLNYAPENYSMGDYIAWKYHSQINISYHIAISSYPIQARLAGSA